MINPSEIRVTFTNLAITHNGSMVLVYMLTFIGGILMGSMEHQTNSSTMDPTVWVINCYKSAINPVQSTSVKHLGEIRTVPWFSALCSTSSSEPSFGQV